MWIQIFTNIFSLILLFVGGLLFGIYGVASAAIIGIFINQIARSIISHRRGCKVRLLRPLLISLTIVAFVSWLIEIIDPNLLIRSVFFIIMVLFAIIMFKKIIPESEDFSKLSFKFRHGQPK